MLLLVRSYSTECFEVERITKTAVNTEQGVSLVQVKCTLTKAVMERNGSHSCNLLCFELGGLDTKYSQLSIVF